MPGITLPQRRQRVEDDEEVDGESASSSHGSKRARLSPDEVSEVSEDSEEEDLLPNSYRREPRRSMQNEHQPGSIVRIKVKNFVTYSAAEFKCGPSLNMIIGPNGTGKSTLVCAICLGLGSRTSVLGRAKQIGEYVKHGHGEAEIEVELTGGARQRGRNPIIKHTIKRADNKSTWQIDGRHTTHREVKALVESFHIQIDNLCQFLPQDRVVEFARLSSVDLLKETQLAAAPAQMTEWHEKLKGLGADRKKRLAEQETSKENLAQLQKRQDAQRADVERMTERKRLLEKVEALGKCRPGIKYTCTKRQHDELKHQKEVAEAELRELHTQVEPALQDVNAKNEYRVEVQKLVHARKTMVEHAETRARSGLSRLDDLKKQIEQCATERATEKDSGKKRRDEARKTQQQLTNLKNRLDEEPVAVNTAEFNERIREKQNELRGIGNRAREIQESMHELKGRKLPKEQERQDIHQNIANLKSKSGQQMLKLQQYSRDTHKAWIWIQKNQNMFSDRIYGPAILEISVNDQRYASALESKMQGGDWLAFTATNKEDWNRLRQCLTGSGPESLKLKQIHIRVANRGMDGWQRPVAQEQLESFGLEAFMIDLLNGPEPVLSMLCDNARMHSTGVSLQEGNERQYERLQDSPIDSWVAGKQLYRITRRKEYGVSSTSNTSINEARIWTDQGVDMDAERGYQQKLREVEQDLQTIDEEYESLKGELNHLAPARKEIEAAKKDIETEKANLQKARSEWEGLPVKINTLEEKLASYNEAQSQLRQRIDAITAKEEKLADNRANAAVEFATLTSVLRKTHADLLDAEIWLIEAGSELSILTEASTAVRDMLKKREQEVIGLQAKTQEIKDLCKRYLSEFRRMKNTLSEEDEEFVESWVGDPSKTIQDLDNEIESTQQRLELLHEGNPRAIVQYEERAKEIDRVTEKIANHNADVARMTEEITSIRDKWEPELDHLVSQISTAFSHNFEKIHCAGQVDVHKDEEDFNLWSIRIKVKFRETEQMSVLDSHRQSGGERAVSTIFYLMALQSLARSPFRVVDEINQGMDPRNERLVHERMVDIACSENTSQYFLITPKLLNGLKYHERMVVHTIYSGETMPEDNKGLDMKSLADLALRVAGKVN